MGVGDAKIREKLIRKNPTTMQAALRISIEKEGISKAAYGDHDVITIMYNQPEKKEDKTSTYEIVTPDLVHQHVFIKNL